MSTIPDFLGIEPSGDPVAEAWYGAHPTGPARFEGCDGTLEDLIASEPLAALGSRVAERFDGRLPFLVKLLAVSEPLSLQVHPSLQQARSGFDREQEQGIPVDSPDRLYKDCNHKPEMVYPLAGFDALIGFKPLSALREELTRMPGALAQRLRSCLGPDEIQSRQALTKEVLSTSRNRDPKEFEELLDAMEDRYGPGEVAAARRLVARYPGDPSAVVGVLLNHVSLSDGTAAFLPSGMLHSYLSGFAVEIMSDSDNVLRAGLTPKHVDTVQVLECADYSAEPEMLTPREHRGVRVLRPALEDFALLDAAPNHESITLPASGPRIVLGLHGCVTMTATKKACLPGANHRELVVEKGQAVFVLNADGELMLGGAGRVVVACPGISLNTAT